MDGFKVFVIDDSQTLQKLISKTLEILGVTNVTCFDNALDGLIALQEEVPSLIILDINMPGMNGYELMSKIRKNDKIKDVPILAISGDDSIETKNKAIEAGAFSLISKPIDAKMFLSNVLAVIKYTEESQAI